MTQQHSGPDFEAAPGRLLVGLDSDGLRVAGCESPIPGRRYRSRADSVAMVGTAVRASIRSKSGGQSLRANRLSVYSDAPCCADCRSALKDVRTGRVWKWTAAGFTLGGAVAGPLGSTAGGVIGTVAGLGFAAKDAWSDRKDRKVIADLSSRLEHSPGATQSAEQTMLEDLVLDDFRTMLDTRNTEAGTVPVVLFWDDAQWADPVTLRFLSRLLADAREQHWPLLVLATHWEAE